jgi:hypothetical protein
MKARRETAALVAVVHLASSAWGQTKLTPKYQEGGVFKTKETVKTRQVLKLGGQNLDTAADTAITSETKVGKRNEQGELTLETTYTEIVTQLTLPGDKKVSYNSKTDEAVSEDPNYQIILDRLKALKGISFTIILDKDNKIKSVAGIKPEVGVSPDDIKVGVQAAIDRYPPEAVKPGDQWSREVVMPLGEGQYFTLKRKYTYVGPEVRSTVASTKKLEKVTAATEDIQYSLRPTPGNPATVSKSNLKMESGEAVILFDPAKGRSIESLDKMHVTGTLVLSIMNVELNGELDLTIEAKSEELE